jgi:hypothetical protein
MGMREYTFDEGTPRGVLIRDFLIFQLKNTIDGLKDAVVFPVATLVVVLDLAFGSPHRRGRTFYSLMAACESFDRWLNLHGAAKKAGGSPEGLFAGSEPGDGTMVGDIEEWMGRGDGARSVKQIGQG